MRFQTPALLSILLFSVLLFSSTLAAPVDDAQYVTVVKANDGALGVIAAANFAAAMQVHGVRFTGALENDLPKVLGLDQKFLVFFDGKRATIVDGKGDPTTAANARSWLEEQNYTVELGTLPELGVEVSAAESSGDEQSEESSKQPDESQRAPCDGCRYGDQCLAPGTRTATQYCAGTELRPLKANGEACASDEECYAGTCQNGTCGAPAEDREAPPPPAATQPKPQNLFSRILHWLFGWL